MADKKHDYENESYWEKVRDFNLSRTPFWISFCFELIETIIPWLAIWLLIGPDFVTMHIDKGVETFTNKSFNFFTPGGSFSEHGIGFVTLISFMYLIWAMLIATITYFLKWQKADVFTYTLAFAFIGFMIIMNGCWMYNWTDGGKPQTTGVRIITDFVICIFAALLGLFLGVIVTTFARNYMYKIEEEDEAILIAYQNGEKVPTKKQLRIERAEQARIEREKQLEELDEFKKSIDTKIEQNFIEEQKKREKLASMTKEELKQYKKEQKAEAKKQKIFNKKNKHSDSKEIRGLD